MTDKERQSNIFWTLEAINEHCGALHYALECERAEKACGTSPEYHQRAIEEYTQDLWNCLSKMLPDEYRASGNAEDSPE